MTGRTGGVLRRGVALFAASVLFLAVAPGTNWTAAPVDPALASGGYALVRVGHGAAGAVAAEVQASGATEVAALDAIDVVTARISDDALRALRSDPRVAFVVDDVLPPWQPRSVLVNADVELLRDGGEAMGRGFSKELMRLHPVSITSWGINEGKRSSRKVAPQG